MASTTPAEEPNGQETLKATDGLARQGLEPNESEQDFTWMLSACHPDRIVSGDEISSHWAKYLAQYDKQFPALNDLKVGDVVCLVIHLRKIKMHVPPHLIIDILILFSIILEGTGYDNEKGPEPVVHKTIAWFQKRYPTDASRAAPRSTIDTTLPDQALAVMADDLDRWAQVSDSAVLDMRRILAAPAAGTAASRQFRHNDEDALFASITKSDDDARSKAKLVEEVYCEWKSVDILRQLEPTLAFYDMLATDMRAQAAIRRRADPFSDPGGESKDTETEDAGLSDA
ncbi:hypothetical protein F5X68DRAFT_237774 [Plectosphaerella plurivora]|uniref:Uncharacterized protein n=1 Tax=Plectosphaerella plurivora TaxID=936078 RepID=A0A9P8V0R1_9PEZI|nr:hypothetical protein F5X68DRAFT_237774 [Plectosphaerella plurivora]